MKTLYKIILVVLLALPLGGRAQCDLPPEYSGNTGSNMTVMITSAALNSLPLTDENAYLVAHTPGGMLIGSSKIYGLSQASIALWGNDSFTTNIDGAIEGENISLQLVDGTNLYDLDLEINFIINSILPLESPVSYDLVCNNEPVACEMPQPFTGNTGSNMTVLLTEPFINSLNVTDRNAYLVAIDPNGLVVGSEPVASVTQTSIAVWGDDTSTPEVDGAAANAAISFQLVDGDQLYDVVVPSSVSFFANGISLQTSAATVALSCSPNGNLVEGCTDPTANNYKSDANLDDNSCTYLSSNVFVTFQVDMSHVHVDSVPADGVYIAGGDFFGQDGILLTDNGSGIWSATVSLAPYTQYLYRFRNQPSYGTWDGFEDHVGLIDSGCVTGVFNYRYVDVAESDIILDVVAYGSCTSEPYAAPVLGCTDENASNYDEDANKDDGSCITVSFPDSPSPVPTEAEADVLSIFSNAYTDIEGTDFTPDWAQSTVVIVGDVLTYSNLDYQGTQFTEQDVSGYDFLNIDFYTDNATNLSFGITGPYAERLAWLDVIRAQWNSVKIPLSVFSNIDLTKVSQFKVTGNGTVYLDNLYFGRESNPTLACTNVQANNYFVYLDTDADGWPNSIFNPSSPSYNSDYADQYEVDNSVCDFNYGCTDGAAFNYDASAVINQVSAEDDSDPCEPFVVGCMDTDYVEYSPLNNTSNQMFCKTLVVYGCTHPNYLEFNPLANIDDHSCAVVTFLGCMDKTAMNYDYLANKDDGTCYPVIEGCTDSTADNYVALVGDSLVDVNTPNDELCEYWGCTYPDMLNYCDTCNVDDGSCITKVLGCMDADACSFNSEANVMDSTLCTYAEEFYGCDGECIDDADEDGVCDTLEVEGCTNASACNYNENATDEDDSCVFAVEYYDCDNVCILDEDGDGVCDELEVVGCQQSNANNYNASATDPGPCVYYGCMEVEADNYNPNVNTDDGSCYYLGCLDTEALNYDNSATLNDPSACIYNVANFGCELPNEYSGLITGANMNILFTSDFTSQITTLSSNAFVVGITESERNVGSTPFQQGELSSITLWGDDVQTEAIDGAVSWEAIRLYLVDDKNLYRINLDQPLNYAENKTLILNDFEDLTTLCLSGFYTELPIYGCMDPTASNYISPVGDPAVDVNTEDGTCIYEETSNCRIPQAYTGGITGSNMNILFTSDFMSSLPNLQAGAYIVAANKSLQTFGSVAVFGTQVTSITIWGDDTGTQEVDGATVGEEYHLYLVNGNNLYDINPYEESLYQNNGMQIFREAAVVLSLCSNGKVVYLEACTDSQAINYDKLATEDDGSCIYQGCTYDVFYEYSEEISVDDGSCENLIVYGCTDSLYVEYHALATEDDGSCEYSSQRISDLEETEVAHQLLLLENAHMEQRLTPIPVDLYRGWNIIGYNLNFRQNIAACFDHISDKIVLAKNNNGMLYWPEFGWNGIGDLEPGQGYQIYMIGEVDDFSFVDLGGMRVEMQAVAPQWAKDMAPIHPNDVRTLVRVVNMLGQEVSVETQDKNTPLLYLYNDGSVEKILTK